MFHPRENLPRIAWIPRAHDFRPFVLPSLVSTRAHIEEREKKLARCYPPFFALTCQIPTGNDVAPEQDPRKGNGKWSLGSLNQRCQGVQKKMEEEFCFTFWLNSADGKTKTERDGLHQRSRELLMLFSISSSSKSSGSVIYYYSSLLSRRRWWRQCAGHMGPAALSFARQGGPFSSSFSVENTKDLLERRRRGGGTMPRPQVSNKSQQVQHFFVFFYKDKTYRQRAF